MSPLFHIFFPLKDIVHFGYSQVIKRNNKMNAAQYAGEFLSQFESSQHVTSLATQVSYVTQLRQNVLDAKRKLHDELVEIENELDSTKKEKQKMKFERSSSKLTHEMPQEVQIWINRIGEEVGYRKFRYISDLDASYAKIKQVENGGKWSPILLWRLLRLVETLPHLLSTEYQKIHFSYGKDLRCLFGNDHPLWGTLTNAIGYLRRFHGMLQNELEYMDVIQALTMTYNALYVVNRTEFTPREIDDFLRRLEIYETKPCNGKDCRGLRCIYGHNIPEKRMRKPDDTGPTRSKEAKIEKH